MNGKLSFQADVSALGSKVTPQKVGETRRHDLPQPAHELRFACSLEVREVAVRLQQRVLHEIGGVEFRLKVPSDFKTSQQVKIMPVVFQQLRETLRIAFLSRS